MTCLEVTKQITLHMLRNSEVEGVVAVLVDEDSTPTPGDPTSLPNEEVPGMCDDEVVGPVDEDALINSKNSIEKAFILKNRSIFSESLGPHRHLLVEPMKILIKSAKTKDPSVYK